MNTRLFYTSLVPLLLLIGCFPHSSGLDVAGSTSFVAANVTECSAIGLLAPGECAAEFGWTFSTPWWPSSSALSLYALSLEAELSCRPASVSVLSSAVPIILSLPGELDALSLDMRMSTSARPAAEACHDTGSGGGGTAGNNSATCVSGSRVFLHLQGPLPLPLRNHTFSAVRATHAVTLTLAERVCARNWTLSLYGTTAPVLMTATPASLLRRTITITGRNLGTAADTVRVLLQPQGAGTGVVTGPLPADSLAGAVPCEQAVLLSPGGAGGGGALQQVLCVVPVTVVWSVPVRVLVNGVPSVNSAWMDYDAVPLLAIIAGALGGLALSGTVALWLYRSGAFGSGGGGAGAGGITIADAVSAAGVLHPSPSVALALMNAQLTNEATEEEIFQKYSADARALASQPPFDAVLEVIESQPFLLITPYEPYNLGLPRWGADSVSGHAVQSGGGGMRPGTPLWGPPSQSDASESESTTDRDEPFSRRRGTAPPPLFLSPFVPTDEPLSTQADTGPARPALPEAAALRARTAQRRREFPVHRVVLMARCAYLRRKWNWDVGTAASVGSGSSTGAAASNSAAALARTAHTRVHTVSFAVPLPTRPEPLVRAAIRRARRVARRLEPDLGHLEGSAAGAADVDRTGTEAAAPPAAVAVAAAVPGLAGGDDGAAAAADAESRSGARLSGGALPRPMSAARLLPGRPFTPPALPALSGILTRLPAAERLVSAASSAESPASVAAAAAAAAAAGALSSASVAAASAGLDGTSTSSAAAPSSGSPSGASMASYSYAGSPPAPSPSSPSRPGHELGVSKRIYYHCTVVQPREELRLPDGVSLETFEELLQWWYTAQLSVLHESRDIFALMIAARYYLDAELFRACERVVRQSLDIESAVDVLLYAVHPLIRSRVLAMAALRLMILQFSELTRTDSYQQRSALLPVSVLLEIVAHQRRPRAADVQQLVSSLFEMEDDYLGLDTADLGDFTADDALLSLRSTYMAMLGDVYFQRFADAAVVTADGKFSLVHQCVLRSRAPRFTAVLQGGRVWDVPYQHEVVSELMKFLYAAHFDPTLMIATLPHSRYCPLRPMAATRTHSLGRLTSRSECAAAAGSLYHQHPHHHHQQQQQYAHGGADGPTADADGDSESPICECVLMLVMSLKELALEMGVELLPSYCDQYVVYALDPLNAPLVLSRSMRAGTLHRHVFAAALRLVLEPAAFDLMQATPRFRALFERDEAFRQLIVRLVASRSALGAPSTVP